MSSDTKSVIKVVRSESNPRHVTLRPNPKTPGIKIFLVGTSLETNIPEEQRRSAEYIQLTLSEEEDVVIVIGSISTDNKIGVHMLSVSWRTKEGVSEKVPYVELERPWVPKQRGYPIQPIVLENGEVCLRTTTGNGKKVVLSTHRLQEDPTGESFLVCPPDLLCQLATGKIKLKDLKKHLVQTNGPATESSQDQNSKKVKTLEARIQELAESLKEREGEKTSLENKISLLESRKTALEESLRDACDTIHRISLATIGRKPKQNGKYGILFFRIKEIKKLIQLARETDYAPFIRLNE